MPYQADGTQADIIAALRAAGCSVSIIAGANGNTGVPDLLVGRAVTSPCKMCSPIARQVNWLLEVKRPKTKGRAATNLSPAQQRWHRAWYGQVAVVRTVPEALAAVGLLR